MTRGAAFDPGFVTLFSLFQMREELLMSEPLPGLRDGGLDELSDAKKFATSLKEEAFVQQTVVEQRASLIPVSKHHHYECACFGSRCCDSHDILEVSTK